jgi:hypothetical protein
VALTFAAEDERPAEVERPGVLGTDIDLERPASRGRVARHQLHGFGAAGQSDVDVLEALARGRVATAPGKVEPSDLDGHVGHAAIAMPSPGDAYTLT